MLVSSLYLAPPKPGWMPKAPVHRPAFAQAKQVRDDSLQLTAKEALGTRRFYWLWLMLFINVTCGIAVISVASPMGQEVVGLTPLQAAAMVGLIGLFNGGGRIAWASLSDYIGRANTYTAFFAIQTIAFFLLPQAAHAQKANLPAARVLNVQLAVEEAVTNICLHAYAEEAAVNLLSYSYRATDGFVLRIRHEKGTFEIDLIDQGPAFNPLLATPLDLKSIWEDPKARGIGIHLMQRMTDDLRYRRVEHKNVLTLVISKGEGTIDKGK
jgi:anti-sigma regulatory factor (Ser/Thr protein kinase)